MRSFNANFITEKNKRSNGPAPTNLVVFDFATPVLLSDRDLTGYEGLIKKWAFIDSSVGQTPGRSILGTIDVPDLDLIIINSQATPFSDNFTTADPLEGVEVRQYQWFNDISLADKELIFKGVVRSSSKHDDRECRVRVEGIWSKYNKVIGEDLLITAADHPSADPDDIGTMHNIGYGSLENVPCKALKAGAMDTLRDDLTDVATSYYVSGSSKVDFPSGSVIMQIDSEQIQGTYDQSTNLLTVTQRDYPTGSNPVAHDAGATVAEVLTEYIYEFLGHPAKSMGAVMVAGVKQTTGYTQYTGQTGDELTGYEGMAVIKFTVLPKVVRQVNLLVDDTSLGVNEGNHGHGGSEEILNWKFQTATPGGSPAYPESAVDGDFSTAATLDSTSDSITVGKSYYEEYSGGPTSFRVCMRTGYMSSGSLRFTFGGGYVQISASDTTTKSAWYDVTSAQDTWAEFNNLTGVVSSPSAGSQMKCTEVWVEVKHTPTVSNSAATGVDITGDVLLVGNSSADTVIGGQVTCDGEGWQDDASGTITGVADALIEQSDHVITHIATNYLGFPLADMDVPAATSTFFNTNGYTFALLINKPIKADTLLARLAMQCRSRFIVTPYGTARLLVRQTGQASGHAIVEKEVKAGTMAVNRSPITDLVNLFTIRSDRDWTLQGEEAFKAAKQFTDATSMATYGEQHHDGDAFNFEAVKDPAMVDHAGAFWLAYLKDVRDMPGFAVFLDNMEIEPGDIIDLTHTTNNMASFVCEVLKTIHHQGSARRKLIDHVEILAIEN